MKSALELMAITANAKAKENTKVEETKNSDTIRFCEALGEELEDRAKIGKEPTGHFYCDSSYRPLKEEKIRYADGRRSLCPYGNPLDIQFLKNWFVIHGFEVTKMTFEYDRFGFGKQLGYYIEISPKPKYLH